MIHNKPHLLAAHAAWQDIVKPGDCVIDATCGNGHDTSLLAKLALTSNSGIVYALDIQKQALNNTKQRLSSFLPDEYFSRIKLIEMCHSCFPAEIVPQSVRLITYNLGYLPGSDKYLKTLTHTTLKSLLQALQLIMVDGLISIVCYPGHPEGKQEEFAIVESVSSLDPGQWICSHQRWINRPDSPSLLFLSRVSA